MIHLELTRTEAETLLDLLEKQDPKDGCWAKIIADDIRKACGMSEKVKETDAAQ